MEPRALRPHTPVVARWRTIGVLLVAAAALAVPAQAAAPNYILVSGPGLKKPVLLDDWGENGDLLVAIDKAPKAKRSTLRGLARRPRYDLAEFWGWGANARPTDPREAGQHGWFYPAHARKRALFQVMVQGTKAPRLASRAALAILARHGIPTRR
jgi:hypothetical protein